MKNENKIYPTFKCGYLLCQKYKICKNKGAKRQGVHVKDVEVWYLLIMIHVYVNYVIGT